MEKNAFQNFLLKIVNDFIDKKAESEFEKMYFRSIITSNFSTLYFLNNEIIQGMF